MMYTARELKGRTDFLVRVSFAFNSIFCPCCAWNGTEAGQHRPSWFLQRCTFYHASHGWFSVCASQARIGRFPSRSVRRLYRAKSLCSRASMCESLRVSIQLHTHLLSASAIATSPLAATACDALRQIALRLRKCSRQKTNISIISLAAVPSIEINAIQRLEHDHGITANHAHP
jgi:hypothetical protein